MAVSEANCCSLSSMNASVDWSPALRAKPPSSCANFAPSCSTYCNQADECERRFRTTCIRWCRSGLRFRRRCHHPAARAAVVSQPQSWPARQLPRLLQASMSHQSVFIDTNHGAHLDISLDKVVFGRLIAGKLLLQRLPSNDMTCSAHVGNKATPLAGLWIS